MIHPSSIKSKQTKNTNHTYTYKSMQHAEKCLLEILDIMVISYKKFLIYHEIIQYVMHSFLLCHIFRFLMHSQYLVIMQKNSAIPMPKVKNVFNDIGSVWQVKKWSRNGQKTLSRPKEGKKCGFQPRNFFQPNRSKNGQKTISRPKEDQKCGFWPPKNFQPNWSKMAKIRYLGQKRFKNVVFGPKKIFSQIGQKMAKIRFLGPKKGKKCGFWP